MQADLGTAFIKSASRYSGRPFLVSPELRRSYQEVAERSLSFAHALSAQGVGPGDRVAIVLRNHPEYVEAILGAACARIVIVPINRRLGEAEIVTIIKNVRAKVLITEPTFRLLAEMVIAELSIKVVWVTKDGPPAGSGLTFDDLASFGEIGDLTPSSPNDLQAIYFTSGTTSIQKGVLRSHSADMAMAAGGALATPFSAEDAAFYGIPLHSAGFYGLGIAAMLGGARLVLVPEFEPDLVLEVCEREHVTHTTLVPTMWEMLRACSTAQTANLSSLRHPLWGGMPSFKRLNDLLERWLPVPCVGTYGLTEATCATYSSEAVYHDGRRRSSGYPILGMEVSVVDDDGRPCDVGEYGQVLLRGSLVMDGYLDQPELTSNVLRDGWLYTGDLGLLDKDGALTVVERIKDMIISGGENIFAAEMEDTILDIPGVREVAVVGIPDDLWGQRVCAFVVGDNALSAEKVVDACVRRHARFKRPRQVIFVDELPKNALGKVLKSELAESVR